MTATVPGWTQLAERPLVLAREYSFGAGRATALAVLLPDRKWMIVSPPRKLSEAEAAGFDALGSVVALVANNGTHYLGLGPCMARFPQAVTYATQRAAARIRKHTKDAGQLASEESLKPLVGENVALLAMDGDKIGDVLVRVKSERGTILYVSDMIANIQQLPKNFLFRLFFKLSDRPRA